MRGVSRLKSKLSALASQHRSLMAKTGMMAIACRLYKSRVSPLQTVHVHGSVDSDFENHFMDLRPHAGPQPALLHSCSNRRPKFLAERGLKQHTLAAPVETTDACCKALHYMSIGVDRTRCTWWMSTAHSSRAIMCPAHGRRSSG